MISLLLPARLSRETPFQAIEISWISSGLRVPPPCILRKSPCISQKCRERRVRWGLHPPPRSLANGEISWQPRNGAQLAGFAVLGLVSAETNSVHLRISGELSLAHGNPFPGNGDRRQQRRGSSVAIVRSNPASEPRLTADVTKPARKLWPPNVEGSKPRR